METVIWKILNVFQDSHNVEVAGIINDTVGTLLSCAFKKQTCRIGIILGKLCYLLLVVDRRYVLLSNVVRLHVTLLVKKSNVILGPHGKESTKVQIKQKIGKEKRNSD